jgi:lipid-A-disaccharide synthase
MRYYIIAGERSGDLHAGNLVRAIKQYDPQADFRGFGGDYMESGGVKLTVHYRDLAFMGLVEILTSLNKISRYIRQCKEDIQAYNPDVIILVDYGGFNRRIAKYGKKNGITVFYYIPPKVWAWYQSRAKELKANVDQLFVILPFEKEFFKRFDWDVDYVGNPVLDAVKAHTHDAQFLERNSLAGKEPLVALLPGSRRQELRTIIPLMAAVVAKYPMYHFAVAAVSNLEKELYAPLRQYPNVTFIFEDTYNLLQHATAAIVTSGTATLETALFRVPQVVVYKTTSSISYWLLKQIIKVDYISLVNLIAGKEVVKEMIQGKANPEDVSEELIRMLDNASYRANMLQEYDQIIRILDTGSASDNAAKLMTQYLRKAGK